jgi:Gas vesicle synthesis protein GvpL/GvpF
MPAASRTAKYVYGVVRGRGGTNPKGKGIAGKPLRVVAADGIGALTSDVPAGDLEAGREELMTHSRVLEGALEKGVVLPMRFGVVMPDEAAVRSELLDAHREELEAQLDEMAGKAEMNVKAIYDEAAVLGEVLAENRDIARLRESIQGQSQEGTYYQRIELGERIVAALEEKRAGDEAGIVEQLSPHALAVEVAPPMHERMAVNASFLVADGQMKGFDDALDEIAAENRDRLRVKATGPLPPHSFVELELAV